MSEKPDASELKVAYDFLVRKSEEMVMFTGEPEIERLRRENKLMRRALEFIAGNSADQLQATQARGALANIGPSTECATSEIVEGSQS